MIKINLLPLSERKKRSWSTQRVIFSLLAVMMLFGIFILIGMDIYRWYYYTDSLRKINYSSESIRKEIERLTLSLSKQDTYFKKISRFVELAEKEDANVLPFLLFTVVDLPEGVWLDSLSIDGNKTMVEGRTVSDERVGLFVSKLKDSGVVKDISMPVISYPLNSSEKFSTFSFSCELAGGRLK